MHGAVAGMAGAAVPGAGTAPGFKQPARWGSSGLQCKCRGLCGVTVTHVTGGCVVSHIQPWGGKSSLEAALRSLRTQAEVQDLQAGGKKLLSAWRGLAALGCHWHRIVTVAHGGEEAGR